VLDSGDFIDGDFNDGQTSPDWLTGEAGVYICQDLTEPGPYEVTAPLGAGSGTPSLDYDVNLSLEDSTDFKNQFTAYPVDINSIVASSGPRPLVVISHGGSHDYRWSTIYKRTSRRTGTWRCRIRTTSWAAHTLVHPRPRSNTQKHSWAACRRLVAVYSTTDASIRVASSG